MDWEFIENASDTMDGLNTERLCNNVSETLTLTPANHIQANDFLMAKIDFNTKNKFYEDYIPCHVNVFQALLKARREIASSLQTTESVSNIDLLSEHQTDGSDDLTQAGSTTSSEERSLSPNINTRKKKVSCSDSDDNSEIRIPGESASQSFEVFSDVDVPEHLENNSVALENVNNNELAIQMNPPSPSDDDTGDSIFNDSCALFDVRSDKEDEEINKCAKKLNNFLIALSALPEYKSSYLFATSLTNHEKN